MIFYSIHFPWLPYVDFVADCIIIILEYKFCSLPPKLFRQNFEITQQWCSLLHLHHHCHQELYKKSKHSTVYNVECTMYTVQCDTKNLNSFAVYICFFYGIFHDLAQNPPFSRIVWQKENLLRIIMFYSRKFSF